MKLAWLGNLGNVGFNYVRLLNTGGIEARLYLPQVRLKALSSSNPENEYQGASRESFIHPFSRNYLDYFLNRLGILGPLSGYENLIGNGSGIVQAQTCYEIAALRIKRKYGIPYAAMATGADLSEIAFSHTPLGGLYRTALENCSHLFLLNFDQFDTVGRLNLKLKSFGFLPFSINLDRFKRLPNIIREKIIVYSVARLDWSSATRASTKRNDIFFRGFARVMAERERADFELWIADWGVDRIRTRSLIKSLNIESFVKFIPVGDKNIFYENLARANVIVDQFNIGSVGLSALESMAMSRPVFAYCDRSLAQKAYGSEIPVINCSTDEDVFARLKELTPGMIARLSERGFDWIAEHHAEEKILKILLDTYRGILSD